MDFSRDGPAVVAFVGVSAVGPDFTTFCAGAGVFGFAISVALLGTFVVASVFATLVVSVVATDVGAVVVGSFGGPVIASVVVSSVAFEVAGSRSVDLDSM